MADSYNKTIVWYRKLKIIIKQLIAKRRGKTRNMKRKTLNIIICVYFTLTLTSVVDAGCDNKSVLFIS